MAKTGIQISKTLIKKIKDEGFKKNIEKLLKQKSGGKCFLCGSKFNFASDLIHADHNVPESDGGTTDYDNLNLAHANCNKFKKNNPTLLAQKFLPFRQFLNNNSQVNFDKVSREFFVIKPKPIVIEQKGKDFVVISFPNNTSSARLPIYTEVKPGRKGQVFQYVFLQAPACALVNDNVQPRDIKIAHILKIFMDLHLNPLHEPSSVRLEKVYTGKSMKTNLLMFDGQHKTVAKMLVSCGKDSLIDIKLYLGLSKEQATVLVNTIQSKIIKLGLSKSEFAAKMGDEYVDAFNHYEESCELRKEKITEAGFIKFFPKSRQAGAKKLLIQSRINEIFKMDNNELNILEIVEGSSKFEDTKTVINETTFINKIICNLLHTKPLSVEINEDEIRILERNNIRIILNAFYEKCLYYDENSATGAEIEKVQKLKSQSSLSLFTTYISEVCRYIYVKSAAEDIFTLIDITADKDKIASIKKAIERYANHPIWVHHHGKYSLKVKNFYDVLQKNGTLKYGAESVGLDLAYLLGVSKLKGDELAD